MTREEAVEYIKCGEISNRWGKNGEEVERMAIKALEAQTGWIPVSDRVPEEHKIYLVTYVTKTGRLYVRDCECSYAGQSPRHIEWSKKINGEITAWMPLPKPYEQQ